MASYAPGMEEGVAAAGGTERVGPYVDEEAFSSERTYATFVQLTPLLTFTGPGWVLALIVAIVMWRLKANESPFLDDHGREATNFLISLAIWAIGLTAVGVLLAIITLGIGAVLVIPLAILASIGGVVLILVGSIRGAMAASRGEYYRYPATFRVIR